MRHKSNPPGTPASPSPSERLVRDIRRVTRKHYSAEDKIRIVLDGLRGEVTNWCSKFIVAHPAPMGVMASKAGAARPKANLPSVRSMLR
jgi:hypothetical protein